MKWASHHVYLAILGRSNVRLFKDDVAEEIAVQGNDVGARVGTWKDRVSMYGWFK